MSETFFSEDSPARPSVDGAKKLAMSSIYAEVESTLGRKPLDQATAFGIQEELLCAKLPWNIGDKASKTGVEKVGGSLLTTGADGTQLLRMPDGSTIKIGSEGCAVNGVTIKSSASKGDFKSLTLSNNNHIIIRDNRIVYVNGEKVQGIPKPPKAVPPKTVPLGPFLDKWLYNQV